MGLLLVPPGRGHGPLCLGATGGNLAGERACVAQFWELSSSGLFLTQLDTTRTISAKNLEGWHLNTTVFNMLLQFIE